LILGEIGGEGRSGDMPKKIPEERNQYKYENEKIPFHRRLISFFIFLFYYITRHMQTGVEPLFGDAWKIKDGSFLNESFSK
jgi:hypothetical protein